MIGAAEQQQQQRVLYVWRRLRPCVRCLLAGAKGARCEMRVIACVYGTVAVCVCACAYLSTPPAAAPAAAAAEN